MKTYTAPQILDKVNAYLNQMPYARPPQGLYEPIAYELSLGGKRIRPVLMLMAYNIYKDKIEDALYPATAIETYHNYTLIHDDVMDRASIRRGKPTVCAKWGDTAAILSGDTMLVLAYEFLSHVPAEKLPRVLSLFTETAKEIGDGQQYDLDFENRDNVTEEEYMEMIRLKTSVLLASALKMGGILADAPESDLQNLYSYGEKMGLAFQLQDDLLDSYGDERLGKKIGGDILEGKKTCLMLSAMSRASEEDREVLRHTYQDATLSDEEKIFRVREVYDRYEIPKLIEQQISIRFDRALSILDSVAISAQSAEQLRVFARSLMGRKK